MDGIPALDLWDLVIHVLHSNSNQKQKFKQARGDPSHCKASAEIADIEQTKKIVPLITCEVAFCQFVFALVFGVNVFDLNLGVCDGVHLFAIATCLVCCERRVRLSWFFFM